MHETIHADGHAKVARWETPQGVVQTPNLVWPETSLFGPRDDMAVHLVSRPSGATRVELVSAGTWFHPQDVTAPLVVPNVRPGPTTDVQLLSIGDELAVLHDGAAWMSNPRHAVPALVEAKRLAQGRLFWLPGVGVPDDYALWCYLGVDLFDAMPLMRAALSGERLSVDGREADDRDVAHILADNIAAARAELAVVERHIRAGTLRSLVERRVYAKPASVELLRRFDREHSYLELAAPRHRTAPLPCHTYESLWGPEVEVFRRRLRDDYAPPATARVLVILPCSLGKPYKLSRSHRIMGRVLEETGVRAALHEVMLTSPLGVVPRELEEVYPVAHYDVPVTGHWMRDEEEIIRTQMAALLDKAAYDAVVVHAGQESLDVLRDLLPDTALHTCLKHPTHPDDLERLKTTLLGLGIAKTDWPARRLADMQSLLTFQFGAGVARTLTQGATVSGRPPFVKLERDGKQLGTTTPERGVVSLTLDGARVLADAKRGRVFIGDFTPKKTSTLFAVGVVGADPDVRPGDEVAVVKPDGTVVACGVAAMDAVSMTHAKRGAAVNLRHLGGGA